MASDWNVLSFLPAIIFAVEIGSLFFMRRPAAPMAGAPKLQIWIQDLLILSPMFALSLLWRFERATEQTAAFSLFTVALGFAAAVDMASSVKALLAARRALVFVGTMAGFIVSVWLCAMLWFLWKRGNAWRTDRRCADNTARNFAAAVTLVYAVAFFLPMMPKTTYPQTLLRMGWDAYFWSFAAFFNPKMPGEVNRGQATWMGNPCLWIAVAFLLEDRRWLAAVLAFAGAGLALAVNNHPLIITTTTGTSSSVTTYPGDTLLNSPAYAVWFSSMVLAGIVSLTALVKGSLKER